MRLLVLLWAVFAMVLPGAEVLPEDRGAAAVWQAIRKVETNARVLYIVAHPDDEDAALLTYLARGKGYDVTLLSLTRGESGANLITGDTFDNLGVLRTLELEKACKYYGVRLRFGGFADYGYSKNIEEALRKWPVEQGVAVVSKAIQEVRPQVVITRFSGTARDGHGQHQYSGNEAVRKAVAANRMIVAKFYQGGTLTEHTLRIDSGGYDAMLGRSYAEIGREGYRWHRSQAMGAVLAKPGPVYSYLHLASGSGGPELFDGVDVAVAGPVAAEVAKAKAAFRAEAPSAVAPHLARALAAAKDAGIAGRLREALNLALGVELEALVLPEVRPTGMAAQFRPWTTFAVATPGQKFQVSADFRVRSGVAVERVRKQVLWGSEGSEGEFTVSVPENARASSVNWTRGSIQEAAYQWLPAAEVPRVQASYVYQGVESFIESDVETSSIDSIGLQVRRKLAVGPALSVRFVAANGVAPMGTTSQYRVDVVVTNVGAGARSGEVRLELPAGVTASPEVQKFAFQKEGEEARFTFALALPGGARDYNLRALALSGGKAYDASFLPVTFAGLDTLYVSKPAVHVARVIDVQVSKGLRVGYVMGSGDGVPEALRQLGVPYDLLSAADVAGADLSKYTTLLLGIRAYAVRPELKVHNARLLEFVNNGGTVIVQYNTQEYDGNYGPYPYTMTARAEEISEEDSPVRILTPAHPVFVGPNRITGRDFEGWVEQRGSKFWMTWAPEYTALLETQDTGQAPQRGGWLEAKYGKGRYVYCAYAWYRQLPYAVPGAFRLFANLISLGAGGELGRP
ncbi:hypothetical protein F183_A01410 [Bryobacterales bacterium F-183]|nr:hypothetical protein F183_A01410 [Bryobacterales bacterium F-183]